MILFAYLVWDPKPWIFPFDLPILNRPILWYGFLFALGFFVGYLVLIYLLRRYFLSKPDFHKEDVASYSIKAKASKMAEQLTFYVLIGAIVGARLGDVLFYQNWSTLLHNPLSVFAIWQGGLASHGGAIGILIALWLFSRSRKIPFWLAVDFTVIPTAIAAVFIRIGNFFNQEILGTSTTLPWGIIFLHPADGGQITPRHPAQLYEALWYLLAFVILLTYWHRHLPFKPVGRTTGLFLVLIFGFRILVEWIKVEQSAHFSTATFLTMGQILSIPFVILGCYLIFKNRK